METRRVIGHLCGEFTGHGEFPAQRPVTRSFDIFFDLRLNKRWVNNREPGDLRRYRAHYDVSVMIVVVPMPVKLHFHIKGNHTKTVCTSTKIKLYIIPVSSGFWSLQTAYKKILPDFQIIYFMVKWKVFETHLDISWWRHQMETFSALLAICAGNSPVPGEFPAQRPLTRSFDVFFDLRLNEWLSTQSWGLWFETLLHPLWRHPNDPVP